MKHLTPSLYALAIASAVTLLALAACPTLAVDLTAEQIAARNVEARGGLDAWKAIDDARIEGSISMTGDDATPVVFYYQRPNKMRVEYGDDDRQMTQVFDGEQGWTHVPEMGEPMAMLEMEMNQARRQADFEGPLIDHEDKGHELELVGTERTEDGSAYRLRLTLDSGEVFDTLIDTETFLELRQEGTIELPDGQEIKSVVTFEDYERIDDVLMYRSIVVSPEGIPEQQVITLTDIDLDPDLDDDLFEFDD